MKHFLGRLKIKLLIISAVIGPGLITAFADNDAGGVATYSVAASKFGYSMLTVLIPITIVLMITQEIGSRIAVISGKGLADLIRERYGVRIALLVFALLFFVNFNVILQNIGGIKAAIQLFHFNAFFLLPLIVVGLFFFITFASYTKIERFFLFLILFYLAYFASAVLAKPDWGLVAKSLFVPERKILSISYLYTAVAVLGTTVTAWGQFFINSYIKDKKITIEQLKINRFEIYVGAVLTDIFSLFMMVAVAATIFQNHIIIRAADEAALAIQPFAGDLAFILFGVGLFIAGCIGAAIVPLATAYAFSEFFGYEGSLDQRFDKSKLFYGLFLFQIVLATVIIMLPNISLFRITLFADFLNGIFLPIIFFFLYRFVNNVEIMGEYRNNKLQNILLVGAGIVITIAALAGGMGELLHL